MVAAIWCSSSLFPTTPRDFCVFGFYNDSKRSKGKLTKLLFRKPLRLFEKRVRSSLLPWFAYLVMQLKLRLTSSF